MTARASWRLGVLAAAGVTAILSATGAAFYLARNGAEPSQETGPAPARPSIPPRPSLDCAFHDMMRRGAVVSFYFDVVVTKDAAPQFYERAVVASDGSRTSFAGDERPVWRYALDEDGAPRITSPDGATQMVLYGLRLGSSGVLPVEAGIRSNQYRNLGGECRQSHLGFRDEPPDPRPLDAR